MQHLDPKVIFLFFIKNLFGTAYVLPLWFIGVFIFEKIWLTDIAGLEKDIAILLLDGAGVIFFAILVLYAYCRSWLTYINFTYELQPDGLHVRNGILIRRKTVIEYNQIEAVDLLINPLVYRLLQLYSINIRTRQIDDSEGIFKKKRTQLIPGLTHETAQYLRPELLRNAHFLKLKNPTKFSAAS